MYSRFTSVKTINQNAQKKHDGVWKAIHSQNNAMTDFGYEFFQMNWCVLKRWLAYDFVDALSTGRQSMPYELRFDISNESLHKRMTIHLWVINYSHSNDTPPVSLCVCVRRLQTLSHSTKISFGCNLCSVSLSLAYFWWHSFVHDHPVSHGHNLCRVFMMVLRKTMNTSCFVCRREWKRAVQDRLTLRLTEMRGSKLQLLKWVL